MTLWRPLEETLTALVTAVRTPEGCGLVVTEASIEIPLEAVARVENGQLRVFAIPPHSRWKTGVLPPVHLARLEVRLTDEAARGW
jgi:hypothetical protein